MVTHIFSAVLRPSLPPSYPQTHVHTDLSGSRRGHCGASQPHRISSSLLGDETTCAVIRLTFDLLARQVVVQGSSLSKCSCSVPQSSGEEAQVWSVLSLKCFPSTLEHPCLCFSPTRGSYMTLSSWASSPGSRTTSLTISIPWMKT